MRFVTAANATNTHTHAHTMCALAWRDYGGGVMMMGVRVCAVRDDAFASDFWRARSRVASRREVTPKLR